MRGEVELDRARADVALNDPVAARTDLNGAVQHVPDDPMVCPHCQVAFHATYSDGHLGDAGRRRWDTRYTFCPECRRPTIWLTGYLVNNEGALINYSLDYRGGEQYPHLVRDNAKPDLLDQTIAPLTK